MGILFFVNLCICGLFFTPSPSEDTPAEDSPPDEENNEDIESNGQYETDSIGWNRNIVILSPRRERPDEDQAFPMPQLVDEENTPILLNAFAGLFFPICHTEAAVSKEPSNKSLAELLAWQSRFLQVQILVFNVLIFVILTTVYVLVSSVSTFNYNYNVLDFFWFKAVCGFLGLMGALSLAMSLEQEFWDLVSSFLQRMGRQQRRESGEDLWRKTYLCLLATSLVFLPAILEVVLFHVNPPPRPLLLVAKEAGKDHARELMVLGATVPSGFPYSPTKYLLEGAITNTCNFTHLPSMEMLLINLTEPQCVQLMEDEKALSKAVGRKNLTVIVLDSAEPSGWRVSSPHNKLAALARVWQGNQLFLVRKQDWAGMDQQLVTGAKLTLSLDSNVDMEELRLFPCILQSPLQLGVEGIGKNYGTALLHNDGKISQEVNVPIRCSLYGPLSSCKRWNLQDQMSWRTQCTNISDVDVTLVTGGDTEEVMQQGVISLPNNVTRKTCCLDSDTFVTVYEQSKTKKGLDSEVLSEMLPSCNFSEQLDGSCNEESGQLERSRFCIYENVVIKTYSKIVCSSGLVVKGICSQRFNCS